MSCLGPFAKYSSCLYPTGNETLEEAEVLMLESYCEKARLRDGIDILDLGCGTCPPHQRRRCAAASGVTSLHF